MLPRPFRVLAIETSCDDTAVAVVSSCRKIIAQTVIHQHSEHNAFGGIVPTIAGRLHRQNLPGAIKRVITEAGGLSSINFIAATRGPGLSQALSTGFEAGRCIAATTGLPFYGIHHMEGHALTARLANPSITFPFLCFLISGGHTLLLMVRGPGDYTILGSTTDDSVGEALDKATRLLNIDLLNGESPAAALEKAALNAIDQDKLVGYLPLPLKTESVPTLNFSFSGLKTALKYRIEGLALTADDRNRWAFEFQRAAIAHLEDRLIKAMRLVGEEVKHVVISGGVARNASIREHLSCRIVEAGLEPCFAPFEYCSDNAVMIGWAAVENILAGKRPLDVDEKAEIITDWPLDSLKLNG